MSSLQKPRGYLSYSPSTQRTQGRHNIFNANTTFYYSVYCLFNWSY